MGVSLNEEAYGHYKNNESEIAFDHLGYGYLGT